ncbi:MAG: hypothetical protein NVS2B3_00700 [Vulcanimicrobiaceae bacterium]
MLSRPIFLALLALLAVATAAGFLALSVHQGVYAPGAHDDNGRQARVLGRVARHVPDRFKRDVRPSFVLRKLYSIVAFAIVGFLSAPLIPRRYRIIGSALLVAGFSATIEVVQRNSVSQESGLSSLFDIGCGAFGGAAGALVWNVASARFAFLRRA